jgi:hypothetical protein
MRNYWFSRVAVSAVTSLLWAADTSKIEGPNPASAWCQSDGVVWAVTSDCLQSYRTPIDYEKGFAFESLPPGAYKLVAVCDYEAAYSHLTGDIRVQGGETKTVYLDVRSWTAGNPEVFRHPNLPLNGRILDTAGRPLAGVAVTIHRPKNDGGERETTSESDGRFGFCRVVSGRFTLEFKRAGYDTVTKRIDFNLLNTPSVEIKLRRR